MYRATLEFVEERCGAALRACEVAARGVDDDVLGLRGVPGAVEREARRHAPKPPPPGSLLGVDLLCEGVWRRVCAALLETPELSGLFDLGDADAAHRAVAATDSFREGLAAIAGRGDRDAERHARRRLRGHAKTAELEQRWNLPVYVELVRADLIQAVDGALASEEDAAPALIGAVERCWAGDRFLPAVGDAFGALALELAQRGATGLAARAARAEGHDAHARCSVDCGTFSARIRATLASGFEALLDLSLEDAALLAAGCDEALEACDRAVEECRRDSADDLVGVIDGRLAACKGVAARYHLTGQKPPSEPSSYVAHAAEPLAQFYETWSALLGDAQPDRAQVSERCAVHLETRALAVFDHAAQFETVMAKRGNTASLAEDSRKIAAQLELDVRAFCALVGVEYSAMDRVSRAIGAVLSAPAQDGRRHIKSDGISLAPSLHPPSRRPSARSSGQSYRRRRPAVLGDRRPWRLGADAWAARAFDSTRASTVAAGVGAGTLRSQRSRRPRPAMPGSRGRRSRAPPRPRRRHRRAREERFRGGPAVRGGAPPLG